MAEPLNPFGIAFGTQKQNPTRGEVGEAQLSGSNPTIIRVAMRYPLGVVCTLRGSSAPGDSTSVLTYDLVRVSDTEWQLRVYAWKNTGGTDPTLVASTGTETFSYVVKGY